jgi:hypothetical protein
VFISDPSNDPGTEIDIFSPEGKYLYSSEIRVEEGKSMGRIGFRDNDLVIEVEDEEGEISIRKSNISLPAL